MTCTKSKARLEWLKETWNLVRIGSRADFSSNGNVTSVTSIASKQLVAVGNIF